MPITFGAWIVSTLALTGVFPFAGFWSKDEIIDNVGANGYTFLMWVGLFGAGALGTRILRFRMEHLKSDRVEGEMAYDQKVVAAECGAFMTGVIS